MLYKIAKAFHLVGLVTWLGPSTGGYLLLLLARGDGNPVAELWLLDRYLVLIHVEAAGLALMLATGLVMRLSAPALKEARWLKLKLLKVFCVIVPLEAAQLLIYHITVKPAVASGIGVAGAVRAFDLFSLVALVLLAITVPLVFYMAVFKPEIKKMDR
ncbi:MAG: hypothetical protein ACE5EI_02280 [Thermodesulfobacteriota bacterium]